MRTCAEFTAEEDTVLEKDLKEIERATTQWMKSALASLDWSDDDESPSKEVDFDESLKGMTERIHGLLFETEKEIGDVVKRTEKGIRVTDLILPERSFEYPFRMPPTDDETNWCLKQRASEGKPIGLVDRFPVFKGMAKDLDSLPFTTVNPQMIQIVPEFDLDGNYTGLRDEWTEVNLEDPTEEVCLEDYEGDQEEGVVEGEPDSDSDSSDEGDPLESAEEELTWAEEETPEGGVAGATEGDPDSFLVTDGGENVDAFPEEEDDFDPDFNIYEVLGYDSGDEKVSASSEEEEEKERDEFDVKIGDCVSKIMDALDPNRCRDEGVKLDVGPEDTLEDILDRDCRYLLERIESQRDEPYDLSRETIPEEVSESLRKELNYTNVDFKDSQLEWGRFENEESPFIAMQREELEEADDSDEELDELTKASRDITWPFVTPELDIGFEDAKNFVMENIEGAEYNSDESDYEPPDDLLLDESDFPDLNYDTGLDEGAGDVPSGTKTFAPQLLEGDEEDEDDFGLLREKQGEEDGDMLSVMSRHRLRIDQSVKNALGAENMAILEGDDPTAILQLENKLLKDKVLEANLDLIDSLRKSSMDLEKISDSNMEGEAGKPKNRVLNILRDETDEQRVLRLEGWGPKFGWAARMVSDVQTPFIELIENPPITWEFELDSFQKQAILALDAGTHVFVAAHTSAGKTVVAEYAVALAKRNSTRVIYTSPIKALSNQKYRDFKMKFQDIGLITGDLQINDTASCLIMTTEILRSMLYNSSPKISDLEFVIFDEVHYINDPERGHVWEEVLILLPNRVKIVMLSATVPNTMEFAEWVGRTKKRRVAVCVTMNRPIPLRHYLFSTLTKLVMIKDGDRPINNSSYMKAKKEEKDLMGKVPTGYVNKGVENECLRSVITLLKKEDKLPAVVFAFSRKKCDDLAKQVEKSADLTTERQKHKVRTFIKKQISMLEPEDQQLDQIKDIQGYLEKGIGVHHSGILPILKEVVEILFQMGIVKLLFATETFAVGVNMPARTVVFYSVMKFDGTSRRQLVPAEYVQMAGRAGRRGQDKNGTVIILSPGSLMPLENIQTMLTGLPSRLSSQFRLSYSMILATLRTRGEISMQNLMEKSYREHHEQSKISTYKNKLFDILKEEEKITAETRRNVDPMLLSQLEKFYMISLDYFQQWDYIRGAMVNEARMHKLLTAGRVVIVNHEHYLNVPGVILQVTHQIEKSFKVVVFGYSESDLGSYALGYKGSEVEKLKWYRMVSLLPGLRPVRGSNLATGPTIVTLKAQSIVRLVDRRPLNMRPTDAEDLISSLEKMSGSRKVKINMLDEVIFTLREVEAAGSAGNLRCLNETEQVYGNMELQAEVDHLWELSAKIDSLSIDPSTLNLVLCFQDVFRMREIQLAREQLEYKVSDKNMSLYNNYSKKLMLLKQRQYITDNEIVLMRGTMASRIGKFELVITEILVSNLLKESTPAEVAGLFSCLVHQGKQTTTAPSDESQAAEEEESLPPRLKSLVNMMKDITKEVKLVERDLDIEEPEGYDYERMSFELVLPIYEWASGKSFHDLMTMVEMQAGLMVRLIQQLLETLKDIESAAKVMGDPTVPSLVHDAQQAIKRGIVFAPSIYTTLDFDTRPRDKVGPDPDTPLQSDEEE